MKTMRNSKKRGLTLVEILIVIAIIAAVSVVAIPNFMRNHQNANSKSFAQTLKQIAQKMEMIFWGQNPNEYPPITAFPNNLHTWAAPTNLGNISDLERLLQTACEEIRKQKFSAAITGNSELLRQELYNCFTEGTIDYIVPENLQNYWINFMDPYTTGFYSIGDGFGDPKYSNPPVVPPPPPACGDGNADPGEICGEPGLSNCASGHSCTNCACVVTPSLCPPDPGYEGVMCSPALNNCPPGTFCNSVCNCQSWGGGGGGGCFIGDTNILMTDGSTKAIMDVKVGDMVASYDEDTKTVVASEVTKLLIHDPEIYWIINGRIKVTPNHSFYIDGKWKHIGQAEVGDAMLKVDGTPEPITKIELITTKEPIYNLEVKDTHTYYAEGVLVHNAIKGYTPDWNQGNQNQMFLD